MPGVSALTWLFSLPHGALFRWKYNPHSLSYQSKRRYPVFLDSTIATRDQIRGLKLKWKRNCMVVVMKQIMNCSGAHATQRQRQYYQAWQFFLDNDCSPIALVEADMTD